ncbi:MAG TPA: rhodanese-like domain-containing protein [bacterium]|jgi:rhodanese-related sulfurtransferase
MFILKSTLIEAIKLFLVISAVALIANFIRTPLVKAAMTNSRQSWEHRGLNLIDNWSHKGWPEPPADWANEPYGADQETDQENGTETDPENPPFVQTELWYIDLFQVEDMIRTGECTFIDARHPEYYEEGHIPTALNWPADEYYDYEDDFLETLDKEQCIIVYCSGGACDESIYLAQNMLMLGFNDVYLYSNGIEEWELIHDTISGPNPGEFAEEGLTGEISE